ncbi:probable fructokinase-5 isoform X1 [Carica papaya]|uniref:probable fructokinase-5 isoform X1 n=1 Tax=Carica papaya TaxID=3649 RepID=UPI000B8CE38C|nr:probable fructokinase-5 isoform X1 [Carica papaya]
MEEKMGRKSPLIVSFGEMLIDFVPDKAGLSLADSTGFLKAPGGAPANVACAISKLQGNSAFIGKLGDDEFGQMLVDILKKNGVNTDGVCFDGEARTALAFVTLKKNGEREFAFYRNPSADMLMKESELNMGLIRAAKIFHYGSISLISEPCRSAHLSAMDAAKAAGAWLSYDPNVRLPLWPSPQYARDAIFSIWTYADIIKVSDDEVAFLTEGDPENDDVVRSLWYDTLKLLVVTDGEKGCRYITKDFKGRVKGFSVKTIDTTGAGDAFVGALLVYLAQDPTIVENEEKLMEALTFANACGAISTTQKGAIPALPTISDALQLINSKPRASNYFTRTFMLFLVSSVLISILFSFIFGHNKT